MLCTSLLQGSAHPLKLGCLVCMLLLGRRTIGAGCSSFLHQDAGNTVCKAFFAAWLYVHSAGLQGSNMNVDDNVWQHDKPAAVTGVRFAAVGGSAPPPRAAHQTASLGAARSAAAAPQAPRLVACRQAQPHQRPVPHRQRHLHIQVLINELSAQVDLFVRMRRTQEVRAAMLIWCEDANAHVPD